MLNKGLIVAQNDMFFQYFANVFDNVIEFGHLLFTKKCEPK